MEATYFTDKEGTRWQLSISIAEAKRMFKELQVDLDKVEEGQVFMEIATSRMKLAGCLWILCEAQADRLGINEDEFAKRLSESALDEAVVALVGAIVNFTPQSKRKTVEMIYRRMMEGIERGTNTLKTWTTENDETINTQIDRQVTERLEKAFGRPSTN